MFDVWPKGKIFINYDAEVLIRSHKLNRGIFNGFDLIDLIRWKNCWQLFLCLETTFPLLCLHLAPIWDGTIVCVCVCVCVRVCQLKTTQTWTLQFWLLWRSYRMDITAERGEFYRQDWCQVRKSVCIKHLQTKCNSLDSYCCLLHIKFNLWFRKFKNS